MKKFFVQCLINAIALAVIPLSFHFFTPVQSEIISPDNLSTSEESTTKTDFSTIKVFNEDTGVVSEMDFREYIIGVVAGEMPVEFHSEALSAGTAAAATLARKKLAEGEKSELQGGVISTDPAKHQAYMSVEDMKEKWGDSFDKYYEKLTLAVDKAIDYSIVYQDELIVAAYHAISPGKTEDAGNVWSASFPYLKEADSEWDKLSPKYASSLFVSNDEFTEKLKLYGADFPDGSIEFGEGTYTDAGTLISITIGGKVFSGKQLREIFSLRSAAITLSKADGGINFSVRGYGHGVGMSQYGADYLARQGKSWKEIIAHYYPGTETILNYNENKE